MGRIVQGQKNVAFKVHNIENFSKEGFRDKSCLRAIDDPSPDPPELAMLLLDPWTWKFELNNKIRYAASEQNYNIIVK